MLPAPAVLLGSAVGRGWAAPFTMIEHSSLSCPTCGQRVQGERWLDPGDLHRCLRCKTLWRIPEAPEPTTAQAMLEDFDLSAEKRRRR